MKMLNGKLLGWCPMICFKISKMKMLNGKLLGWCPMICSFAHLKTI
ncbi:hypothetical protein Gohar_006558 [Gossypium harknessii]|uniref:Uncharacterized protein n=1 Tax=Gossypium harknessii TaxID=34285 RepID=A0A7J9GDT6_9ROSI|nr:hypothetical protein [Gossypium harknessii]